MSRSIIVFFNILLSIFFAFLTKKKTGSFLRINIIFSFLWDAISLLSLINPLNLIMPDNTIFGLVAISNILFNVIYLLFSNKRGNELTDYSAYFIKDRRIILLNVLAYLLLIPVIISSFRLLLNNGFDLLAIRNEVYVGITNSNNSLFSILCRAIPTAIFIFTEMISSYYAITKKNKLILIIGIVDLLTGTIVFGGRNFILYYVIFYFIHFLNLRRGLGLRLNKKVVILSLLALILVTAMRDVNDLSFFETTTLYYAGSLSFLQYITQNPISYGLTTQHYGLLTFGFIFEPIIMILNAIFGVGLKVPSYYFNIYAQKFVSIGSSSVLLYNNNSTMFYPFMLDFGISGAIIGVFFYSLIITIVDNLRKKGNLRFYFISVFLYSSVINSSISYKLIGLTAAVIFALSVLCVGRVKGDLNE